MASGGRVEQALEDARIAAAAASIWAGRLARALERYFTIVKLSVLVVECWAAVVVAVIASV